MNEKENKKCGYDDKKMKRKREKIRGGDRDV